MTECLKQTNGMPPLVQECTVPCHDDCTFTAWSKFTPCSRNCETTRSRRRQLTGRVCLLLFSFRQVILSWTHQGEGKFQKNRKLFLVSPSLHSAPAIIYPQCLCLAHSMYSVNTCETSERCEPFYSYEVPLV